jgi:cysteinyl-tRNA synthetase
MLNTKISIVCLGFVLLCSPLLLGQEKKNTPNFRQEMRDFVIAISKKAKVKKSDFIVIPQNGIELILKKNEEKPALAKNYLQAIDALAQEDLFYGYEEDGEPTPSLETSYFLEYLKLAQEQGKTILGVDYTISNFQIKESCLLNKEQHFISFAATRNLNEITTHTILNDHRGDINNIKDVQNFLYLLNYNKYANKQELLTELSITNYDLLILDLFFGDKAFSAEEIQRLKRKENGDERLVIAYMSIGEAEEYRFYWQEAWKKNPPIWLEKENPNWEGNYKVKYWNKDWQNLMLKKEDSYLNRIIKAGFDGIYLDIIDAFQYFENQE